MTVDQLPRTRHFDTVFAFFRCAPRGMLLEGGDPSDRAVPKYRHWCRADGPYTPCSRWRGRICRMAVVVRCFLVTAGGACAAYRSAALNLRTGSLYEWSVALVVVRCESSQSSRSAYGGPLPRYSPISLLASAAAWSLLWTLLNHESKSC